MGRKVRKSPYMVKIDVRGCFSCDLKNSDGSSPYFVVNFSRAWVELLDRVLQCADRKRFSFIAFVHVLTSEPKSEEHFIAVSQTLSFNPGSGL